jgi:hypothetical protein
MNRDTARALWYRSIDPSCFTAARPAEKQQDTIAAANPGFEQPLDRWTSIFLAAVNSEAWRPRHVDRPSRVLGAALDRTY